MQGDNEIFHQLEKVRRLGKGNFGSVYLVTHTSPDGSRLYALKHIELTNQRSTFRTAARTEGAVHAALTGHPLIVGHYGSYITENRVSLLLEFCNGGTLTEKRGSDATLWPEERVLFYFLQLCLALKHCHDRGVVHRDVKPENVFVVNPAKEGGPEELRLGDFGLSCFINNRGTYENTPAGTPVCKSPEMTMSLPYTAATDIWSLGVVLYWLMSGGRFPFHGFNQEELKRDILCHEPTALNTQYAKELRELCSQMLSKKAQTRPSILKVLQHQSLVKAQSTLRALGIAVTNEFNCVRVGPPGPGTMSELEDSSSDGEEEVHDSELEAKRRSIEDALAARLAYFLEQSRPSGVCTCGAHPRAAPPDAPSGAAAAGEAAPVADGSTVSALAAAVSEELKAKCPRCTVPASIEIDTTDDRRDRDRAAVTEKALAAMLSPITPITPATPLFPETPTLASPTFPSPVTVTSVPVPPVPAPCADDEDWVFVSNIATPAPQPAPVPATVAIVDAAPSPVPVAPPKPPSPPTPSPVPSPARAAAESPARAAPESPARAAPKSPAGAAPESPVRSTPDAVVEQPSPVPSPLRPTFAGEEAHPHKHQRSHRHKHLRPQVTLPTTPIVPAVPVPAAAAARVPLLSTARVESSGTLAPPASPASPSPRPLKGIMKVPTAPISPVPVAVPAVEMTEEEEIAAAAAQQAKFDKIARDIAVLRTQIVNRVQQVTPSEMNAMTEECIAWDRRHGTPKPPTPHEDLTEGESMAQKVASLRERMGRTSWATQAVAKRPKAADRVRNPSKTQTMKSSLHRRPKFDDSEEEEHECTYDDSGARTGGRIAWSRLSSPKSGSKSSSSSPRPKASSGRTLQDYAAGGHNSGSNKHGSEFATPYSMHTSPRMRNVYGSSWTQMPDFSMQWAIPSLGMG